MRTMTRGLFFLASGLWMLVCGQGMFHLTLPTSTPNGTLTASPAEPSGGYVSGTVVTLTAAPSTGQGPTTTRPSRSPTGSRCPRTRPWA